MPEIRIPAGLTFAGLAGGLLLGLVLGGSDWQEPVMAVAGPVGTLWLQALKMTILPLVAGLLFTGIAQTVAAARAGALAKRVIGLFAAVLAASAAIGALLTPALLSVAPIPEQARAALANGADGAGTALPGVADRLGALLPDNVLAAGAEGAMLPFILFVALFALAATRLGKAPRERLTELFAALAGAMMVLIGWVLALAPIGVFALALKLAASTGTAAIAALAHYIVIVSASGLAILVAAYLLAVLGARQGLPAFARAALPAQAVAISTQSSLASLPAMLAGCERLSLRDATSDFVLPLAVAIFRATSPAMNMAVALYAAQLAGVEIGVEALLAGALVALLVSLSTVSLPGTISFVASVGPIALAMGVPVEPLALLVAVEMLPDIMRTLGNVTMNIAVTATADRGFENP